MTERLGPATNGPAGPSPDAAPTAENPADAAQPAPSPADGPDAAAPPAKAPGSPDSAATAPRGGRAATGPGEDGAAPQPDVRRGPGGDGDGAASTPPADEPSVPRQARRIGHVCEAGLPASADGSGGVAVDVAECTGATSLPGTTSLPGPAAGPAAGPEEGPDPLEHPDPAVAADAAGVENLLRCWIRENGVPRPAGARLRLPLDASGTVLGVPVRYWSATGCHRFGPPVLEQAPAGAPPVDAVTLAALLRREAVGGGAADGGAPWEKPASDGPAVNGVSTYAPAHLNGAAPAHPGTTVPGSGAPVPGPGALAEDAAELIGRVANSVRCTAIILRERRDHPATPYEDRFLDGEQSLILGHPLHPTPKSREGLSEGEIHAYSPELRGSFRLHWLAVDRSVLAMDSAWTARGRAVPADLLTAGLAGLAGEAPAVPAGSALLPLHPWQAREVRHRPEAAALLDAGLLRDLGAHGAHWHPTSSVRTVHCPGADAMLKLSLGLRITNSRRENLRKELQRGVEVHRLLRSGLAEQWRAAHPGFDVIRDPAWLAVTAADGTPVRGLDVVLRHNPFGPADDAVCVAGLTSPRPWPGHDGLRSRLADLIGTLTARTGRPTGAVAAEWFLRYLHTVVRPVLWLDGTAGVALEAHQQNTLVVLDADGWPVGGRYRDNQGYYFRESRRAELDRRLPGIGVESDTFVPDDVTDERFAYYLGINNILGLIGAFGAQKLADEGVLLAAFRRFLASAATEPKEHRSPLAAHLLGAPALRCKANLLTRLHGLDELVGPVDTQSVYVTLPNPLAT
ncbi:IucA/IucC family protein [Streptomyces sp. CA-132043]|uniref:IucA/IucC family protein n=1 Tax=Streptomyces sp. CA-132043 TaxID=3240048 RepID=UPI003D90F7A7